MHNDLLLDDRLQHYVTADIPFLVKRDVAIFLGAFMPQGTVVYTDSDGCSSFAVDQTLEIWQLS